MTDETQARRLAEWLEGPAGGEPPEDVDPDVLAAVYALRPDRAPAPRVSLDDILGAVKEGPFAAPTTTVAPRFPESAGGASVVPLRSAPPERRSRRFPGWVYPLVGVGFAAAATMAIVLPTVADRLSPRSESLPASEAEMPAAAAPVADATTAPTMPGEPIPEATEPRPDVQAEGGAMPPPPPGALTQDLVAAPRATPAASGPAPTTVEVPADEPAAVTERARATAAGDGSSAREEAPSIIAEADVPKAKEAERKAEAMESVVAAAPAAPAKTTSTTTRSYGDDADESADALAAADLEEDRGAARRDSKKADAVRPAEVAAPAAATGGATTTATTKAPTGKAAATAVGGGSNGLSDRQRGVPLDYNPSWYAGYADVAAIYAAAAAQEKAGAWADAAALYEPLAADARTDVAQDAAWRAAKARWSAGDTSRAISLIDAALRRGGQTVFRAHLYVLKGDILAARGQPLDAARAWAAAAAENQRRVDADEAPNAAAPE